MDNKDKLKKIILNANAERLEILKEQSKELAEFYEVDMPFIERIFASPLVSAYLNNQCINLDQLLKPHLKIFIDTNFKSIIDHIINHKIQDQKMFLHGIFENYQKDPTSLSSQVILKEEVFRVIMTDNKNLIQSFPLSFADNLAEVEQLIKFSDKQVINKVLKLLIKHTFKTKE